MRDLRKASTMAKLLFVLSPAELGAQLEIANVFGGERPVRATFTRSQVVDFRILQQFANGQRDLGMVAVNMLNVLLREEPSRRQGEVLVKRRAIYSLDPNELARKTIPGGLQIADGFIQSVRPGFPRMVVNINYTSGVTWLAGPLEGLLNEFSRMRQWQFPQALMSSFIRDDKKRELDKALKGMKVKAPHLDGKKRNRPLVVDCLHKASASSYRFDSPFGNISVADYFRRQYNRVLRYPDWCLIKIRARDTTILFPIETLVVLPGQLVPKAVKLAPNQVAALQKNAKDMGPGNRLSRIVRSLEANQVLGYQNAPPLLNSNFQIRLEPMVSSARILPSPPVIYGQNQAARIQGGAWNLVQLQVYQSRPPAGLSNWWICNFSPRLPQSAAMRFGDLLVRVCNSMGIPLNRSFGYLAGNGEDIEAVVKRHVMQEPHFLLFILDGPATSIKEDIKRWGDVMAGIPNQIILFPKITDNSGALKNDRALDQYCRNLALKINSKIGGTNCVPHQSSMPGLELSETVIMGLDVSHPGPGSAGPSVAGLASSVDPLCAYYIGQSRVLPPRQETVIGLESMIRHALVLHYRYTKMIQRPYAPPSKILLFRQVRSNGVSEGQFEEIINVEVAQVKEGIAEFLRGLPKEAPGVQIKGFPSLTFVVVGKNHHFRMFAPKDERRPSPRYVDNCKSGTVIDQHVTNPYWDDYYLLSHPALLGTSRPAHYSVLCDESGFTPDQLQQISFYLCHLYTRATRAVSIPAPGVALWPSSHMPDRPLSRSAGSAPSARELFDDAFSGRAEQPNIPVLRTDRQLPHYLTPKSLVDYRALEGEESRDARLRSIWMKLPKHRPPDRHSEGSGSTDGPPKPLRYEDMTKERAEMLREMYWGELMARASLDWEGFLQYVDQKEAELWSVFHEQLDLDGNGHLDNVELDEALCKAGIRLTPSQLSDFMAYLTSTPHSHSISFPEFRDFLLLLPRKTSTLEMYRYYAVRRFLGDDGHGVARVNMEGDVTLSAEDRHPLLSKAKTLPDNFVPPFHTSEHDTYEDDDGEQFDDDDPHASFFAMVGHSQAFKFLLAGGLAGAVSRTATAPFDRLKVFLITSSGSSLSATDAPVSQKSRKGVEALMRAITQIYSEAGIRSFWVGNGLNVLKIFPESAIKFLSYESSKRFMAKNVDQVDDVSKISGVSRFISGGIGGIVSQFSIYPLETLKTQMMSSDGHARNSLTVTLKRTWSLGGVPAFYRGLAIGLIGVFPYSAIDMSTFETLKILYSRSTGIQEPGVLALLAFGSISGTVGATSVYPLNLVRTRLQAAGSPGHPQKYSGFRDAAHQTYIKDGWKGFYRGLVPTLAKVVPAVSISYVVYENSKRRLGV
ncbi:hypothetical protein FRB90_011972 [Tulasnella sp. 427]|nr:hypothetical protein FRB90_011972 [Tulasnella sp. 427]